MHGNRCAPTSFPVHVLERDLWLRPQCFAIVDGYVSLDVSDEEGDARAVPDEALHLLLVLDLLHHAPHARIVEVDLFLPVAGREQVFGSDGLPRAEHAAYDLLFGALDVHGLPRLALVPDAERAVFGRRGENVLVLGAVEREARDARCVLPEFVQLAHAVSFSDIVETNHVVAPARQQPRAALVPLHAIRGVVGALATPVYRACSHACLGLQVLPYKRFLLARDASCQRRLHLLKGQGHQLELLLKVGLGSHSVNLSAFCSRSLVARAAHRRLISHALHCPPIYD